MNLCEGLYPSWNSVGLPTFHRCLLHWKLLCEVPAKLLITRADFSCRVYRPLFVNTSDMCSQPRAPDSPTCLIASSEAALMSWRRHWCVRREDFTGLLTRGLYTASYLQQLSKPCKRVVQLEAMLDMLNTAFGRCITSSVPMSTLAFFS